MPQTWIDPYYAVTTPNARPSPITNPALTKTLMLTLTHTGKERHRSEHAGGCRGHSWCATGGVDGDEIHAETVTVAVTDTAIFVTGTMIMSIPVSERVSEAVTIAVSNPSPRAMAMARTRARARAMNRASPIASPSPSSDLASSQSKHMPKYNR